MSCSWKACAPVSTVACLRLASSTATSKIAVPVRRVLANAASSASTTVWMRAASRRSSGNCSPITSIVTAVSSCMKPVDADAPPPRCAPDSSRRLRMERRSSRRST